MAVKVKTEDVYANWSSLPFEVLHRIFTIVEEEDSQVPLCRLALICKSWLQPAQLALYSTVEINSLAQLRRFHNVVENNTKFGSMVKVFELNIYISKVNETNDRIELLRFFTPLLFTHLPNLEKLMYKTLDYYTPVLDALLGSRLKKLKYLEGPSPACTKNELANFITCCFLLKDRLQSMIIADNSYFEEELGMNPLFSERLYKNLNQFDKLATIHVDIKSNEEINALEYIVQNCKSLNNITIEAIKFNTDTSNNSSFSLDEISNFIPANHVKTLKIVKSSSKDLLVYVMHKFPQLQTLSIKMENETNRIHLTQQTLTEFFTYLSRIDSFSLSNFRVDKNTITRSIGAYWKSTTTCGSQDMSFTFKKKTGATQTLLNLSKQEGSLNISTSLTYCTQNFDWVHPIELMRKNGKFIRELKITHEGDNNMYYGLSKTFIENVSTYCPNLKCLHLNQCYLKETALHSESDYSKRLSINELSLGPCILLDGVLEHWSLFLPGIKLLRLGQIFYRVRSEQPKTSNAKFVNNPVLEINMPSSNIDSIVFKGHNEITCVKIFLPTKGVYFYYRCDPSGDGSVSALNKSEYTEATNHKRIYVCCKTNPDILFEK